jgi:hypothetical protein
MTSPIRQQRELLAVYSIHQEAVATFERAKNDVEHARSSFARCVAAVNRIHHVSQGRVFFFTGSPLVSKTTESPTFVTPGTYHRQHCYHLDDSNRKEQGEHATTTSSTTSASASASTPTSTTLLVNHQIQQQYDPAVAAAAAFAVGPVSSPNSFLQQQPSTTSSPDNSVDSHSSLLSSPLTVTDEYDAAGVIHTSSTTIHHDDSDSHSHDDDDDDIPIHARLLTLPKRCNIHQLAFVSLYNLALTTHLSVLQDDDDVVDEASSSNASPSTIKQRTRTQKQKRIRTALRLWRLVYSSHWRLQLNLNLKPVHMLSIWTNLGHAQFLVDGDTTEGSSARHCYETVLSAIQIVQVGRKQPIPGRAFFQYRAVRMLMILDNNGGNGNGNVPVSGDQTNEADLGGRVASAA